MSIGWFILIVLFVLAPDFMIGVLEFLINLIFATGGIVAILTALSPFILWMLIF